MHAYLSDLVELDDRLAVLRGFLSALNSIVNLDVEFTRVSRRLVALEGAANGGA